MRRKLIGDLIELDKEEVTIISAASEGLPDNDDLKTLVQALNGALAWEPQVRLIGNVKAGDLAKILADNLSRVLKDNKNET